MIPPSCRLGAWSRPMALAVKTCLGELADQWLTLPGYFGANAGLKVTALVAC
jgi:hypothetical protein